MNRRGFFTIAAAVLAGMAADPEKLLWVPGKKRIFIPRPITTEPIQTDGWNVSDDCGRQFQEGEILTVFQRFVDPTTQQETCRRGEFIFTDGIFVPYRHA